MSRSPSMRQVPIEDRTKLEKQRTIQQRLRYNLGRSNLELKGELSPKV